MSSLPQLNREDYTVGWICALPIELAAAKALLEERHENPTGDLGDDKNVYCTGAMAGHNVVIVCLPAGRIGNNPAATVATQMQAAFKGIRIGLMVGIGGGVPATKDIRLGDVVVSEPNQTFGGVVQYDKGKDTLGGFERTGSLNSPPQILLSAVQNVKANMALNESHLSAHILSLERFSPFQRQKAGIDVLFKAAYDHVGTSSCKDCSLDEHEQRSQRQSGEEVQIHYGTIASGNKVIKSAIKRDEESKRLGGILCFEMEAAGLMDTFPCLVIRGISDYADSHKNKDWQAYAAGTAASYAKEVLSVIPPAQMKMAQPVGQTMRSGNERRLETASAENLPRKRRKTEASSAGNEGLQQQTTQSFSIPSHAAGSTSNNRIEEKQALLRSLMFDQIDARQANVGNAHAKTCRWLLRKSEYTDWLNPEKQSEHDGFLWIKGKPGAGKSTLMKYAFLNAKKAMKDRIVISFFFNARGDGLEKSTIGAYRALLFQIFEKLPALQNKVFSLGFSALNAGENYQWTIESLKSLLEEVILDLGGSPVVFFIDALDECEEEQIRDMVNFLASVGEQAISANIRFQVCFASRPYPHITLDKGLYLMLDGQEEHREDIARYLESELKIGKSKLAQQVRTEIQEKASGVFMWVVLVTRILNKEYDKGQMHALRRRLRDIPEKLDELFRDILTRDSYRKDELLLCIQWVLFAKRPLSPEELYFAILSGVNEISAWNQEETTIEDIQRSILNNSKGLVEITKSKLRRVQFIHESVRDFLLKDNALCSIWSELGNKFEGQSHERLKICCLSYLATTVFDNQENSDIIMAPHLIIRVAHLKNGETAKDFSNAFPLLEYTIQNVLHHADIAQGFGIHQGGFLQDFPLPLWIKCHNLFEKHKIRRYSDNASLPYLLAEHNLANLILTLAPNNYCFHVEDERYGCPLFAAMATGSQEAVEALLEPLKDSFSGEGPFFSALHFDMKPQWDHQKIKRDFKYSKKNDILFYLLDFDYPLATVIYAMLESNLDADERDLVILLALDWENEVLIRQTLDTAKFDLNKKIGARTPLTLAVWNKGQGAVKLLLETNMVDVNLTDGKGNTPLHVAVLKGEKNIVEVLLEHEEVDVNLRNERGNAPLHTAISKGNKSLVKLLLGRKCVDLNALSHDLKTAFHLAVEEQEYEILQLILQDENADLNIQDKLGMTALHSAVYKKDSQLLRLLLDTGRCEINVSNTNGMTPFASAAKMGNAAVMRLLLNTGKIDVNRVSNEKSTPLSLATWRGHVEVVRLLLATEKIDLNSKNSAGETPLYVAAQWGYTEIVRLLLAKEEVNVNKTNVWGSSPLSIAVRRARTEVVRLLLDVGKVNVNLRDDFGETPILIAANGGHTEIVRLLLDTKKVIIGPENYLGHTPLSIARLSGYSDIVKLLELYAGPSL